MDALNVNNMTKTVPPVITKNDHQHYHYNKSFGIEYILEYVSEILIL